MARNPLASIIVVNWNGKEFIRPCLRSLLDQSYPNREIIVVDNDSSDGSADIIEGEFPRVRLIRNGTNVGFAEGNNIGIRESRGEIVCLFNPDAVSERDWLSVLVRSLQSSDRAGACAGKLYYLGDRFGKDAVFCTWSKIGPYSAIPHNFHRDEPVSRTDYLTGAAMAVKRSVIDRIGPIDDGYFLYFDETDWCARMIRAGYDLLYVPTAVAWHAVSATVSDSDKKAYFMERNRIRFALKNFDRKYLPGFCAIVMAEGVPLLLRDVRRRSLARSRIRLRAVVWNIANLPGTLRGRSRDFNLIKKTSGIRSYNGSLPLRNLAAGDMSAGRRITSWFSP